ncbi:portal protein [Ruegeria phage DSS3-P1]|uniref:portal protein n=1 Tax=Ruegeria phage DSS3-P1 TaxID=1555208 RepID=UPI00051AAB13|nr:portal protein [Ruegeria phage DSS3-P1]YP_009997276.1 portal protein [Ruegeria phage vB_RpoS-V18]YP_009997358.1 portal protein [Ruegeria phage vB_RpoS-V11]YP_009997441.1 portal protein [Ruegeria phage vB_RpoS-V7]AIT13294.1 portal protein [Ruegeria phage DSS3-P1]AWY08763.1 portal protein [Ruegeria phage vB_RpoS-V7]AWY08935.1 portal protein [Ruegeria phage vB_RpoS-V18]AWY09099.1 portal protein [Ruegeria phage vB_RpoS-V11]
MLDKESLDLLGITSEADLPPAQPQEVALVGGAFDAAKRNERTLALWHPPIQSADMDIVPEKRQLDSRARDTLRNDAYVRGGQQIHQDNIVGSLYALNAKPMVRVLGAGFDEAWAAEFQEEVESRFTLWAESLDCWADAARTNTFTDMVRLAVGVHTAGGEVLASVEWLRGGGRSFNTAIQFIDTDRLSNPPDALNNPRLVAGIEKDRFGAPITYHVRMAHPADWRTMENHKWKAVPARLRWGRVQMIHIFEQQRPDQTRGVAAMVSALKEMRITKQFRDVVLQNAVVNATYAASIESELPSSEVFASLGGTDNPGEALGQYATAYLSQIADYSGGAKNLQLDGVRIPHLYPGTKLNLQPAGKGGPLGANFEQSLLRYIAAALGVSYEQLARDYTQTNYSSARAAMAETWKRMNVVKRTVADRFANHVYRLWMEEAVNKRMISAMPNAAKQDGWLYADQRLDALSQAEWIGASKGQIDELKETQAAILRLNNGLSTLEQESARLGNDWRTVLRQRKREEDLADELGLDLKGGEAKEGAVNGSARKDTGDDTDE